MMPTIINSHQLLLLQSKPSLIYSPLQVGIAVNGDIASSQLVNESPFEFWVNQITRFWRPKQIVSNSLANKSKKLNYLKWFIQTAFGEGGEREGGNSVFCFTSTPHENLTLEMVELHHTRSECILAKSLANAVASNMLTQTK